MGACCLLDGRLLFCVMNVTYMHNCVTMWVLAIGIFG